MQEEEKKLEEAALPGEEAGTPAEDIAEIKEKETAPATGDEEEEFEKLFTVDFNISAEELYNFQLVMGGEQIEKNKKRSKIISIVEIGLGVLYMGAILFGQVVNGPFQYLLVVALLSLGVYGLVYYKYFFYSALRKNVNKQHGKVPYFNSQIQLDIYPNKCVECFQDRKTPNYWRNIQGIIAGRDAFYIQLDNKHCLLVPKRCAGSELEPFLREMCDNFEKSWKEAPGNAG